MNKLILTLSVCLTTLLGLVGCEKEPAPATQFNEQTVSQPTLEPASQTTLKPAPAPTSTTNPSAPKSVPQESYSSHNPSISKVIVAPPPANFSSPYSQQPNAVDQALIEHRAAAAPERRALYYSKHHNAE